LLNDGERNGEKDEEGAQILGKLSRLLKTPPATAAFARGSKQALFLPSSLLLSIVPACWRLSSEVM
jgi:hypothetical protein